MNEERAASRITVEQPGESGGSRPRPARRFLPLIFVLVVGALWSFRGEVTPEPDNPPNVGPVEPATTTTRAPLEGDFSLGWVAIDLPGKGEIVELVDTRFGLFAVAVNDSQTTLWRSRNGVNWDPMTTAERQLANAEISALAETELGLVAVGASTGADSGPDLPSLTTAERHRPAVWLSADGEAWEQVPDDQIERPAASAVAIEDELLFGAMTDVVVQDDRLVAVGWTRSDRRGAAWIADLDGRTWGLATTGLTGGGTRFVEAAGAFATGRGLYVVGSNRNLPSLWASADGMNWSTTDPDETLGTLRYDRPVQVTAGGVGLVAIGVHAPTWGSGQDPEQPYSVIWLSRDGEEWLRLAPEELTGVMFEEVVAADPWLVAAGGQRREVTVNPGIWYSTTGSDWEGVDLGLEGYEWGESKINALVQGGPGLIAGGTVMGTPELWVWSPNGSVELPAAAWKRPTPGHWVLRSEFGQSEIPSWNIGMIPGGFLAVGQRTVWRSADGVEWESTPVGETGLAPNRWYTAPVTIEGTVYLVDDSSTIWSSPDGMSWERLGVVFSGWLSELRPGPNGELLIIEYPRTETDEPGQPQLWRSANGAAWSEIALPPLLFWLADVGFVADHYVVAGWSGQSILWVSTETGEWNSVDNDQVLEVAGQIATVGGRIVMPVAGWLSGEVRMLSSVDGSTWELSGTEFPGWLGQLVRTESGLAAIFTDDSGDSTGPTQSLWVSDDGVAWTELGPLPVLDNSNARILPGGSTLNVIVENGQMARLWEWVPSEG